MNDPSFWDNQTKANEVTKLHTTDKRIIEEYEEIEILLDLLKESNDEEIEKELVQKIDILETKTLLNHVYDKMNCFIEVHPGAGGTESCDWAAMLLEMLTNFADKYNYKCEQIEFSQGEEAGIKSAIIKLSGDYAYGYLKGESGIHRLVRISPFDSAKRRHTSFASISVTPELNNEINIDIKEEDIKIDVYHSSGAGGQSVNTTNSAVRITHLPTKTVVTCQNERSQLKNKDVAMKILKSKLYELEIRKQEALESSLKDSSSINFGSQIRSYVLDPYKLVKDHRTNYESHDPFKILNGHIYDLLVYNLRNLK